MFSADFRAPVMILGGESASSEAAAVVIDRYDEDVVEWLSAKKGVREGSLLEFMSPLEKLVYPSSLFSILSNKQRTRPALFNEFSMMLDPGEPSFTPKKSKPRVVMFAGLQGKMALATHFQTSCLMKVKVATLFFSEGSEVVDQVRLEFPRFLISVPSPSLVLHPRYGGLFLYKSEEQEHHRCQNVSYAVTTAGIDSSTRNVGKQNLDTRKTLNRSPSLIKLSPASHFRQDFTLACVTTEPSFVDNKDTRKTLQDVLLRSIHPSTSREEDCR
ncbi:hypothetical protein M8C21_017542 [Ambrosia artemisiifolia]|uniref:Uncharacterized protein n=1 Tax=Ambrosia artemisiifolia TaxID=4212 RepID=A0AAD5C6G1_AMBAR|nr:hypothetical protein M8C21_017542 [Ambrosia artemisiifolia]